METGALTGLVSRYHSIGQFTAYKAEQILVQQGAGLEASRSRRSRASRCRCAWTWPRQLKLPPPLPMFNYAELITPKPERRPAATAGGAEYASRAAQVRSGRISAASSSPTISAVSSEPELERAAACCPPCAAGAGRRRRGRSAPAARTSPPRPCRRASSQIRRLLVRMRLPSPSALARRPRAARAPAPSCSRRACPTSPATPSRPAASRAGRRVDLHRVVRDLVRLELHAAQRHVGRGTVGRLPWRISVSVRRRARSHLVCSTWSSRSARNFWILASSAASVVGELAARLAPRRPPRCRSRGASCVLSSPASATSSSSASAFELLQPSPGVSLPLGDRLLRLLAELRLLLVAAEPVLDSHVSSSGAAIRRRTRPPRSPSRATGRA